MPVNPWEVVSWIAAIVVALILIRLGVAVLLPSRKPDNDAKRPPMIDPNASILNRHNVPDVESAQMNEAINRSLRSQRRPE